MKRRQASRRQSRRSPCPIANALDLVGDKWTLLVVRDLLVYGKRTYSDISRSPEAIPSNILAERLRRLEQAGLVVKKPYQANPVRYEYRITQKGADLRPILKEMASWANRHVPGTFVPPIKGDATR